MWSGHYAAQQAMSCFQEANFSARSMKAYDTVINRKFKKGFNRTYWAAKTIMKSPRIMNTMFNNGKLIKRLIDI
jgi:hypothetical protein